MIEKVLKVRGIEHKTTSQNSSYKIVTFEEIGITPTGKEILTGVFAKRCLWEPRKNAEVLNKDYSALYYYIKISDFVEGKIVNFYTTPYEFNNQSIQIFPCAIFRNEHNELKHAARELVYLKYGAKPLDDSGIPYTYLPSKFELENFSDEFNQKF